ncbi:MAG: glycerophosphodiester phosphodiesterase [Lachnospiraceae bacterium]|nr:glycerophosphodiester phosphodiesterase [Lachnospiraceae bacterium]
MKTLTKETWLMIRQNLGNVLLFELLYRGIVLPVYLRLVNRGLRWTLTIAGYSYLTAANLTDFLDQPWTLLVMLAFGLIGLLLIELEAAALITAFQGSACQQKLTPFRIFLGGVHKTAEEMGKRNWRLGLLFLPHYLVVNLLLVFRCLSHIRPVNFVIQEMLDQKGMPFFVTAFLLLCVVVSLFIVFLGFGCMADQMRYEAAWKKSCQLLKGRHLQVAVLLLVCNLAVALVVIVAYLFFVFVAAVFVVLFAQRNLAIAVLLIVAERVERTLLFVGGILMIVADFAACASVYYRYGCRHYCPGRQRVSYPPRGSAARGRAVAVTIILLATGFLYILDMVYHGFSLSDDIIAETQITAHRGSSRSAPENTMAAIAAAVEEMADYVEVDVQLTKDGVIVLGHDANLKRVAGVNRSMASLTWEEIQELEVGSWFSPEFAGERIPLLEEVLDFCKGKISLNIEIKNLGKESQLPERVVRLIREKDMEEQCVVTSTSLEYLERVKLLAPELRTGYILSAAYGDFYFEERADFISIRASFVNRQMVERAHAQGMAVHAWTVNSKSEMERLRLMEVDNLITDYPVLAREIIYREEATETLVEYLRLVFQ